MIRNTNAARLLCAFMLCAALNAAAEKNRVVILTDISNEPDDQMSLVRALTYANDIELEGLIATTSCWKQDNPDIDALLGVIDAYAQSYDNLKLHSADYPTANYLRGIAKSGVNGYGMSAAANQLDNEGVNLIVSVLQRNDPRPVYFCAWGGGNTLGGAVMKIKNQMPAQAAALVSKIRGYEIALQDDGWAYIAHEYPNVKLMSARLMWKGMSRTTPGFNAWSESWGGNNTVLNAAWCAENVQQNHGPMGAKYPDAIFLWEGDTPSLLYLLPNGLNCPEFPWYGGWGGRFGPTRQSNVRSGTGNNTVDGLLDGHKDYQLYSDGIDSWSYNGTNYTNEYCTVFRWREAFQNDFAARMDRCVRPFAQVNHTPRGAINGDVSLDPVALVAAPGSELTLHASASTDPDGDNLSFSWSVYKEAGTYPGTVSIAGATTGTARVSVPTDADATSIHVILTVKDDGSPALVGYRRVIVTVGNAVSSVRKGAEASHGRDVLVSNGIASLRMPSSNRARIAVYATDGRVVARQEIAGTNVVRVPLGGVTGARVVWIRQDGREQVVRFFAHR